MQLIGVRHARLWQSGDPPFEKDCVLKLFEGPIKVELDAAIPYGCITNGRHNDGLVWAQVGMNSDMENFRWMLVSFSAMTMGMPLFAHALTLWNYFNVNLTADTLTAITIRVAELPTYLPTITLPVAAVSKLSLRLVWDWHTTDAQLDYQLGDRIREGMRALDYRAGIAPNDVFWVSIPGLRNDIPVCVELPVSEAYVDFRLANFEVKVAPKFLSRIPPIVSTVSSMLAVELRRFLDASLVSCRRQVMAMTGVTLDNEQNILDTIVAVSRSQCLPVLRFPPDGKIGPEFCGCYILRLHQQTDFAARKVKRFICDGQNATPLLLLLLYDDKVDGALDGLVSSVMRVDSYPHDELDASIRGLEIVDDLPRETAVKFLKGRHSKSALSEIPKVSWTDIAGLKSAKDILMSTIRPMTERHARSGRSCGILLHGPPGTGKTLLAKAVATEFAMSFISIKGPELLDIYVGESEAHIRELFKEAKRSRPCIIFFDEIDSIGVARGRNGDSGGVADRIVSQLLLEMDALTFDEDSQEIFIIAATNRPDLLDPGLLRHGRFDILIGLDNPSTAADQAAILRVASRKYSLASDVNFDQIAEYLQHQTNRKWSPADLASIGHISMRRALASVVETFLAAGEQPSSDYHVMLGEKDFLNTIDKLDAGVI